MELEQLLTNALFVVNHSGGKDSQALMLKIAEIVPNSNILVVHAPLTEVEWPDTIEHIKETIPQGIAFREAPVASGKSLLDRVEERGKFPDPSRRWCTSDFKRGPIERTIRGYMKENPRFLGRIVNCMGMRRQESPARAKLEAWKFNERNSKAGRGVGRLGGVGAVNSGIRIQGGIRGGHLMVLPPRLSGGGWKQPSFQPWLPLPGN